MTTLRLVLLVVGAVVLNAFNSWLLLDRLVTAVTAVMVLSYLWSKWSVAGVGVRWTVASDRAQVGQLILDRISLRNTGRLPKPWIELRDHSSLPGHRGHRVVSLARRGTAEWEVETRCTQRGLFQIGPMSLRSGDPFGIFPAVKAISETIDVLVYPAELNLPRFFAPAGMLTGAAATERRSPFVTPSVAGIREYAPGDAYNRISWSTTARMGRLMVKEFDIDPTSDVWLLLDLDHRHVAHFTGPLAGREETGPLSAEGLQSTEEYAVTIMASLAKRCLDEGRSVGLIATGSHRNVIPAEHSERTRIKILETLAVVASDGSHPLAEVLVAEWRRFNRHGGLIVVTSSTDDDWINALAHIAERRVHVAVVYVDGSTFDASHPQSSITGKLGAAGVQTYLVGYGDDISAALSTRSA